MSTKRVKNLLIRPFENGDTDRVVALGEDASMGTLEGFDNTLVAEYDRSGIVAFIRLNFYDETHYVNPIVVDPAWQKKGVGRCLMEEALSATEELRFVARGDSIPFYQRLGCEQIPWDMIAPEVAQDCDGCEMKLTCHPQPMRMTCIG